MVKKKLLVFLTIFIISIPMFSAYAATGIYDDAKLLYDTEITTLKTELDNLSNITNWDCAIVTTDNANNKSSVDYAKDYYTSINFKENGILYLLDLDNREIYVYTAGETSKYINEVRLNEIFNSGVEYASVGSYYKSLSEQISMTLDYFNQGLPIDSEVAASKASTLIAGVVIGIIAAIASVLHVLKSYGFKEEELDYDYKSKSKIDLTVSSDNLADAYLTTKVKDIERKSGRSSISKPSNRRRRRY